uniref:Deacetylase sirtuin-type domain-containing protein n=1 Tax=Timema poppense TaxID=170557 RepID=A0A7R9GSF6_TIMPO|nr:unnamed protein product [Timema poppensis]
MLEATNSSTTAIVVHDALLQTFDEEQAVAIRDANSAISCSSIIANLAYVKRNFGNLLGASQFYSCIVELGLAVFLAKNMIECECLVCSKNLHLWLIGHRAQAHLAPPGDFTLYEWPYSKSHLDSLSILSHLKEKVFMFSLSGLPKYYKPEYSDFVRVASAAQELGAIVATLAALGPGLPGAEAASPSKKPDSRLSHEDSAVEKIRNYLAEKLALFDRSDREDEVKVKVLDEVTLDGIVKYIKHGKAKNIVTMAGAGISTRVVALVNDDFILKKNSTKMVSGAGIPDFRSPGSGLYHNLEKYKLPDPQAIFEIGFFKVNPQPFFTLAKELYPGTFKPTVCHYFVRLLYEKGLLLRHYTQNIDTLERVAGIPGEKLVEAHGTFHTSHCLKCRKLYDLEWMKGLLKFFKKQNKNSIFGLNTHLLNSVKDTCPRLLINREKAGQRDRLMRLVGMSSGLDFDSDNNVRDVAWLGDCDEGCQLLADKLGWGVSFVS